MFGTKILMRVLIGVAILALVFGGLWLRSCVNAGRDAAQSRVDKGETKAAIESGAEAMNTVSNVAGEDARIDSTVRGGRDEILSQPAGNSNAAAVRAACRMRSVCADVQCAPLRQTDPAVAACRRAVGATP